MEEAGLELSVVGVSGAFLYDEPRFAEIRKTFAEFQRLNSRLSEIEYKLSCCNDPLWLVSFGSQCRRLKRDPKQALTRKAAELEREKAELTAQSEEVKGKLLLLEPTALDTRRTLAYAPSFVAGPQPQFKPRRKRDCAVAARNTVIDSLLHLSNLGICKGLDDEFPPTKDRPAPQFVDSWFRRYRIKTFVEAYERCRHDVETMIWRRRRKARSPGN